MKGVCIVVTWDRPSQPNGVIKSYNVQLYIDGVWHGRVINVTNNRYIVQDGDIPSDYRTSDVFAGVSETHLVTRV